MLAFLFPSSHPGLTIVGTSETVDGRRKVVINSTVSGSQYKDFPGEPVEISPDDLGRLGLIGIIVHKPGETSKLYAHDPGDSIISIPVPLPVTPSVPVMPGLIIEVRIDAKIVEKTPSAG